MVFNLTDTENQLQDWTQYQLRDATQLFSGEVSRCSEIIVKSLSPELIF